MLHQDFPIRAIRFDLAANGIPEQEAETSQQRAALFDAIEAYSGCTIGCLVNPAEEYVEFLKRQLEILRIRGERQSHPLIISAERCRAIWKKAAIFPLSTCNGFVPRDKFPGADDKSLLRLTLLNLWDASEVSGQSAAVVNLDNYTSFSIYHGRGGYDGGWISNVRGMLTFYGTARDVSRNVMRFLERFSDEQQFSCRLLQASWRDFSGWGGFLTHKVSDIRRTYSST